MAPKHSAEKALFGDEIRLTFTNPWREIQQVRNYVFGETIFLHVTLRGADCDLHPLRFKPETHFYQ